MLMFNACTGDIIHDKNRVLEYMIYVQVLASAHPHRRRHERTEPFRSLHTTRDKETNIVQLLEILPSRPYLTIARSVPTSQGMPERPRESHAHSGINPGSHLSQSLFPQLFRTR